MGKWYSNPLLLSKKPPPASPLSEKTRSITAASWGICMSGRAVAVAAYITVHDNTGCGHDWLSELQPTA